MDDFAYLAFQFLFWISFFWFIWSYFTLFIFEFPNVFSSQNLIIICSLFVQIIFINENDLKNNLFIYQNACFIVHSKLVPHSHVILEVLKRVIRAVPWTLRHVGTRTAVFTRFICRWHVVIVLPHCCSGLILFGLNLPLIDCGGQNFFRLERNWDWVALLLRWESLLGKWMSVHKDFC